LESNSLASQSSGVYPYLIYTTFQGKKHKRDR